MSKVAELVEQIRYHSDVYYNHGQQEISDYEFDCLVDMLRSLDPTNPILSEVGSVPSYGRKISHPYIMGSLNKVNSIEELNHWSGTNLLVVSPKIDGLAVRLQYQNGKLELAATRGNGSVGQDVTDNVRYINSIPKEIPGFSGELRGEIYMSKHSFKTYATDKANPRNAAAGALLQKDPAKTADSNLSFFCYDIMTDHQFRLETEKALYGGTLKGIQYVPTQVVGDIESIINQFIEIRESLDFEIDGLVFSFNDIHSQEEAGVSGNRPKGKMAFKFPTEQKSSTIQSITWQVGRTGKLTPVARINQIQLAGSSVCNLTLHNWTNINNLQLRLNDEILVEKAGDIIPQLVRVISHSNQERILPPLYCPVCNTPTSFEDGCILKQMTDLFSDHGVSVWCFNPSCPAQFEERVFHYLRTLETKGIGPGTISTLRENGTLKTLPDLYKMNKEDVIKATGGDRSATIVIEALRNKNTIPLDIFLSALGIQGLGKTTGKLVANHTKSLENLMSNLTSQLVIELTTIDGIGQLTANNIVSGLQSITSEIVELTKHITVTPIETKHGNLSGMSFCLTGSMSRPRKLIEKDIESAGGEIKSVSKGLTYLVQADPESKSSKSEKAKALGTQIISEEQLMTMLG